MRKRSKYRPKDRLLNPLGYVVENSKGLADQHQQYVATLKIKNHAAMFALTQGQATRADMLDYHDELFEHITVKQLDQAIKMVRHVIHTKKAKPLPEVTV
jgi:hypothetical protein